jgi:hypothetical protein
MSKPKLKAQQIPVYRVRAADFEEYVGTVYNIREYDFALDVGCQPGEVFEYQITGRPPQTVSFADKLQQIRRGHRVRRYPNLMLEALVMDGYIPAGKYIIDTRPDSPLIVQYTQLMQRHGGPTAPECIRFLNQHRNDRTFQKRAKTLNECWGGKVARDLDKELGAKA